MAIDPITPPPAAPSRGEDPDNFNDKADALMAWQPVMVADFNRSIGQIAAEATATNYNATSATSLAIGTGAKTFTASTGKNFSVGQFIIIASTASVTNYMLGQVTAYDAVTGAMSANVTSVGGSGTFAAWTIALGTSGGSLLTTGDQGAAGGLRIGSTNPPFAGANLEVSKDISGSASSSGIVVDGTVKSGVTVQAAGFQSNIGTEAASFTLTTMIHFNALPAAFGSGSAVTTQIGFHAPSQITGGTFNYGFVGSISAATGRWNLYMAGSASNYIAGALGIGTTAISPYKAAILGDMPNYCPVSIQNNNTVGFSGLHCLDNAGGLMGHFGYANADVVNGLNNMVYIGSIANRRVGFTTNDTVRAFFDEDGVLQVNIPPTASVVGSGRIRVVPGVNGYCYTASSPSDHTAMQFVHGVSEVGTITVTAGGVAYNVTSDQTLKNDKGELTFEQAIAIIQAVTLHNFSWKANGQDDIGAFAQELYAVYPSAVTRGGWRNPANGQLVQEFVQGWLYSPWSVNYPKFIPLLVKACQHLAETQTSILGRLDALEAG